MFYNKVAITYKIKYNTFYFPRYIIANIESGERNMVFC